MKFSDDTIILSLLTCKSDILNQDWTGLWNRVIKKNKQKKRNWRNDGRCRILCRSNLSNCLIWSYLVALQYFFTQSCYVHAILLSNAYKQQRDVNITVHSNDITQVTLYKHTESAFTWLINVDRDCKAINQHLRFLGDSRISVLLQCLFFPPFFPSVLL